MEKTFLLVTPACFKILKFCVFENEAGLVMFNLALKIFFAKNQPSKVYGNLKLARGNPSKNNISSQNSKPSIRDIEWSLRACKYCNSLILCFAFFFVSTSSYQICLASSEHLRKYKWRAASTS